VEWPVAGVRGRGGPELPYSKDGPHWKGYMSETSVQRPACLPACLPHLCLWAWHSLEDRMGNVPGSDSNHPMVILVKRFG
jgi:hypothetical protein